MGTGHIVPDWEWDAKVGCGYRLVILMFVVPITIAIGSWLYNDVFDLNNSKRISHWHSKAKSAYDQGNLREALELNLQILEIESTDRKAVENYTFLLCELERYNEAISSVNEALLVYPNNDFLWRVKGIAKREIGDFSGSIEAFNNALEHNPKSPVSWNNLGNTRIKMGQYNEAVIAMDNSVRLSPNSVLARSNRAYALLKLDKIIQAELDIRRIHAIEPNHSTSWYYLGLIRQEQNSLEEACEAWIKARTLGSDQAQSMIDSNCSQ